MRLASGRGSGSQKPPASSARPQPARQLQQRERVAAGLGDDPVAHLGVQPPADRRGQQRARVDIAQPGNGQPGQAGQLIVVVRLARGEDHGDRLGQQPPGRERQALHRGPVEPLRVIDQAGQRLVLRRGGQQAQHRQPDQEPIRRRALPHAERDRERVALRSRQLVQPAEHRHAQLVQPGERQLHLGLHPPGPDHPKPHRPAGRIVQQRRLPDPGLAAHDQHGAATPARLIQHPIQHRPLPVAIQQSGSRTTSGRAHCCSDPAAQLATAADVISVGHWNEDHRRPGVPLRGQRPGTDAAGQVRGTALNHSAAAREGHRPPTR